MIGRFRDRFITDYIIDKLIFKNSFLLLTPIISFLLSTFIIIISLITGIKQYYINITIFSSNTVTKKRKIAKNF